VGNEEVLHRVKQERNIISRIEIRKTNWIRHVLGRNSFIKTLVKERKKERKIFINCDWVYTRWQC
jgi:hypothetical protein